jgi:FdhD protein
METTHPRYRPDLSDAGLEASRPVRAVNEFGEVTEGHVAAERPLTVYLDKREIVTLMTLGTHPELLVLGWLRNQRLVAALRDVAALHVDWETSAAAVTTRRTVPGLDEKLGRKTVTTGCGQGTVFGNLMDDIARITLLPARVRQSEIYALLDALRPFNEIYRQAGAVHGCALCSNGGIELFVEDVGRHNAVDAIAGHMWLSDMPGHDRIFYTTGRLTSEMVIKVAQMGVPVLVSRSGITQMGLELARTVGITLIARARGSHFLIYNGAENVMLDAVPSVPTTKTRAVRG